MRSCCRGLRKCEYRYQNFPCNIIIVGDLGRSLSKELLQLLHISDACSSTTCSSHAKNGWQDCTVAFALFLLELGFLVPVDFIGFASLSRNASFIPYRRVEGCRTEGGILAHAHKFKGCASLQT